MKIQKDGAKVSHNNFLRSASQMEIVKREAVLYFCIQSDEIEFEKLCKEYSIGCSF